jgi:capsular exopolysaccharide synthesis family protein
MESVINTFDQKARPETAREAASSPARSATFVPGDQLVSLHARESFEANMYRVLMHRIEDTRGNGGRGVIAVTSPGAGEGKTTTAINLAGTLAQSKGSRVLLVDADLRLPDVATQMGIRAAGQPGLSDALLDAKLPLEAVVCHRPPLNLSILTSGRPLAAPYETLRSPRLGEILDQARRAYDFVIVDTPPVLPVPDCRVIARWVDSLLLVVAAHRTPRKYLEEALNALDPEKVAGLVFNSVDPPRSGPYAYYRGYAASSAR